MLHFVSDFIDALTDPRAYVTAQEKRAEMLRVCGVEESDIETDGIVGKRGATNKKSPGILGMPGKKPEEKGEFILVFQSSLQRPCTVTI